MSNMGTYTQLPVGTASSDILRGTALKCSHCGWLNDHDANYCIKCGSSLEKKQSQS